MDKRVKGTLVGVLCSLVGVGVWILFASVFEIIAGLAGALMGILFILPYLKINPEDKSVYPYVLGGILIVVEIVIAEMISLAIIAAQFGVGFGDIMAIENIGFDIMTDILTGIALSALVFVYYVISMRNQRKKVSRKNTDDENMDNVPKDDTSEVLDTSDNLEKSEKMNSENDSWKID